MFPHRRGSDKSPWRAFVEGDADALSQALRGGWGLVFREPAAEVVRLARGASENGIEGVRTCCDGGRDDGSEGPDADEVCVRYGREEKAFGIGRGESPDGADKRDARADLRRGADSRPEAEGRARVPLEGGTRPAAAGGRGGPLARAAGGDLSPLKGMGGVVDRVHAL